MTTGPHDHADETADERSLLLSAYVDGDATADERARVEADPALLAEARRLLEIKAAVADVPRLADDARSRLLGAALAESQTLGGVTQGEAPGDTTADGPTVPSAAVPPPAPLHSARRSRPPWLLQAAAAAVAVVAAGGIAVAVWQSGNGDDSAGEGDRATVLDSADEPGDAAADGDWDADDEAAPMEAAPESATEAEADDTLELEDDGAVADMPDDEGAVAADADPADDHSQVDRTDAGQQSTRFERFSNDHELIRWYRSLDEDERDAIAVGGGRKCQVEVLTEAVFDGIDVVIAVDDDEITAYDADTCEVVTVVEIP